MNPQANERQERLPSDIKQNTHVVRQTPVNEKYLTQYFSYLMELALLVICNAMFRNKSD